MRSAEDIGGGNRILFEIESGSSPADGTLFNRQARIGADSPWGTVRAGRQYSLIYIPFKGHLDAFGAGTIASGLDNLSKTTPYESDAITYLSAGSLRLFDHADGLAARWHHERQRTRGRDQNLRHAQRAAARVVRASADQRDGTLRAGGVSYVYGALTGYLAFFNGDGGTPRLSQRWRGGVGSVRGKRVIPRFARLYVSSRPLGRRRCWPVQRRLRI